MNISWVDYDKEQRSESYYEKASILPDLILLGHDVSYEENISLILKNIEDSVFRFPSAKDKKIWIENLIYEEDSAKRVELIRNAHLKAIVTEPTIVPLFFRMSGSISQNGWKANYSKLWLKSPFWKLRYTYE